MTPKETAIDQVITNNRTEYLKVYGYAKEWIRTQRNEFTSERLKTAYLTSNDELSQPNLYGAVFNSLAKEELIVKTGYDTAKLPSAHGRIIAVWRTKTPVRVAVNVRPQLQLF